MTRFLRTSVVLALTLAGAAVPASTAQAPRFADRNPLVGQQWWVDREWSPS